jgi:DNA-binding FadR family transcriptional regulator
MKHVRVAYESRPLLAIANAAPDTRYGASASASARLEMFGRDRLPGNWPEPGRAKTRNNRAANGVDAKVGADNPEQALEDDSNPGLNRKLGAEIALRLEEEFLSAGWSVGQVFGLQSDIQRRYNIGRWALREAIRILEMRGSAVMRRGRGGGLTIAHPVIENIMKPCALHLLKHRATREQFDQAKRLLTMVAGQLIARRHMEAQHLAVELADTLSNDRAMLTALAKATDNPAFQFVEGILRLVGGCRFMGGERMDPLRLAPIVSAVAEARYEMLPEVVSHLSSYRPERPQNALDLFGWIKPGSSLNHCRYSAQLAFKILDQIMARPSEKPVFLGSEWEMAEQYNYSPEVVRQASRILEDMGVIESRLGRNGGLFTRKPGETEVSPQIFAYCVKQSVSLSDAVDVLAAIEQRMAFEGMGEIAANPVLALFASLLKAYAGWAKSSNAARPAAVRAN